MQILMGANGANTSLEYYLHIAISFMTQQGKSHLYKILVYYMYMCMNTIMSCTYEVL